MSGQTITELLSPGDTRLAREGAVEPLQDVQPSQVIESPLPTRLDLIDTFGVALAHYNTDIPKLSQDRLESLAYFIGYATTRADRTTKAAIAARNFEAELELGAEDWLSFGCEEVDEA